MAGSTLISQSAYDAEHEEYTYGLDATSQRPAHMPPAMRLMHHLAHLAHSVAARLPGNRAENQQPSKADKELKRALRDIM